MLHVGAASGQEFSQLFAVSVKEFDVSRDAVDEFAAECFDGALSHFPWVSS